MTFVNEGAVTRSGSGTTEVTFAFNNNGSVDVVSGALKLYGVGRAAGTLRSRRWRAALRQPNFGVPKPICSLILRSLGWQPARPSH